jgi:hypothetical protein
MAGVQLHDLRRTRRAVQAGSRACGEPFGFLACSHADLERDQSLVSEASRARCHLCCLDAAPPATDQGTSQFLPSGALGARYAVISICRIVDIHQRRGAHWQRRRTGLFRANGAGRASADPRGARMHGPGTFRTHSRSPGRTAVSTAQAGRARKRCLDAPGTSHWHALRRQACGCMSETLVRICSRSSRRVARRRRTFWYARESHGAHCKTKTRSAMSFRRPALGRARRAVRSRFPPGMVTLGVRRTSSLPVGS